ncbi:hypothetical protein W97_03445 [Coniosporium apollinis CBS 100218]|uniref:BTB domain-containing protein n=1 Tax=Coniosporium apollinis (strain CBS 100218) TaxID=1168221 RepID=R7YQL7_CONA1|nr:uncharacterized protein W97_03445 [Coniosporium apollinis CBS 100218]EON64215.1 hypothetical protein W97_03445 [Coniosporium apollinis CBS 100218]
MPQTLTFTNDPKFSDLTVVCESESFHVHRIIVYGQSEYFDGCFSEEATKEHGGTIELFLNRKQVQAMLQYMYSGVVSGSITCEEDFNETVEEYHAAGIYDVLSWKDKLETKIRDYFRHASTADEFLQRTKLAYSNTHGDFDYLVRKWAAEVCVPRLQELLSFESTRDALRGLIGEFYDFWDDLVDAIRDGAHYYILPTGVDKGVYGGKGPTGVEVYTG